MSKRKRRPTPSLPIRLENWAGHRPQRLREIDALCAAAWLPPEPPPYWYVQALPDAEAIGEP